MFTSIKNYFTKISVTEFIINLVLVTVMSALAIFAVTLTVVSLVQAIQLALVAHIVIIGIVLAGEVAFAVIFASTFRN